MNILLVTDSYPPEIRTISSMCKGLAHELVLRGHRVTVATSWPKYNLDSQAAEKEFSEYTVEENVDVIRIRALPHHRVNMIFRGISELILPFLFLRKIRKYLKYKIDAVIVYSPPLPLAFVGKRIKDISGARYLLNIQDIFPQNAIDLGIIKSRLVARFFEYLEQEAYKAADKLTSHTEGGRAFLTEKKGVLSARIDTVPNWIDVDSFRNAESTGMFRRKYGLGDRFILLFAGVLGPAQKLGFVVQVARRVTDLDSVCFLFVGDGSEKQRLQELAAEHKLTNVSFQPFVSAEQYPMLVREADVGLVCLADGKSGSTIPGKILGFMAASVPVVAFLDGDGETRKLIENSGCGYFLITDDPDTGADIVRKIYRERSKLRRYGENGYAYVFPRYSRISSVDKIEELITV